MEIYVITSLKNGVPFMMRDLETMQRTLHLTDKEVSTLITHHCVFTKCGRYFITRIFIEGIETEWYTVKDHTFLGSKTYYKYSKLQSDFMITPSQFYDIVQGKEVVISPYYEVDFGMDCEIHLNCLGIYTGL